jgi:hypothetical protein
MLEKEIDSQEEEAVEKIDTKLDEFKGNIESKIDSMKTLFSHVSYKYEELVSNEEDQEREGRLEEEKGDCA